MEVTLNPDFQRKKQAVHFALCTVLTQDQAAGAVNSWVQNVSTSNSLFNGLNLFARKVCETYGQEGRQGELAQALSRALMMNGVESFDLAGEPVSESSRSEALLDSASELSGPEISTPEFASFQLLLLAMLQDLARRNAGLGGACREFILSVVDGLPWSSAQQEQVIKLVNNGETTQTRPYRAGQLKALLLHMRVWMKDILGDDIAEEVVSRAIGKVESSSVGVAYSPRVFF